MQPAPDLRECDLGAIFDVILDTSPDEVVAAGDFDQLAQGANDQLSVADGLKAAVTRGSCRSWWQQPSSACADRKCAVTIGSSQGVQGVYSW